MKRRSVTRMLALASCLLVLSGEVMPVFAQDGAQAEETFADGEETEGEEDVSGNEAISGNDAVSENDVPEDADSEEETVSDDDSEKADQEEIVSEDEIISDNEAAEEEEETPEEDLDGVNKPSGNPAATATLGDNVTGSIYYEGGKVILYVDGKGTTMSTEFKDSALKNYAITDVVFGGNVTTICNEAFQEVGTIQRVVFSGNILEIENDAFWGCGGLTSITFEKGNGELKIGDRVFKNCTRLNNVTIPKRTAKMIGGETTYYGVFSGCTSLTNAAIEDGAKYVPECAFIGASALTNISVPASVTEIGDHAFEECSILKSFTFTGSVKRIGASAFKGTAFAGFTIPGTVTELGNWAFENCKALTTVGFAEGSGELKFGDGVFKNCINLDNVTLPKRTAKEMGAETSYYCVFSGCTSLTTAALEAGIPYVPENAFMFAEGLTKVTIPSSVKVVYDNAFEGCIRLGAVDLPSGVTKIGREAFQSCTSLTRITIPDKVTSIDDYAFQGCTMLEEIRLSKSIKTIKHWAFAGCSRLAKVYCAKSKDKIKISDGNDPLINAEWIKISGSTKEDPVTGELTLDGVKVNSLKAAFKMMKDKNKDYHVVILGDLKGEKNLTIPKTAKSVTITGNGHTVEITGTKFTANAPLILESVKIRAVDKNGKPAKFTLNAKKGLMVNKGVTFEGKTTEVRSGAEISITGALTVNTVSCKELRIYEGGMLGAVAGCKINVKQVLKSNGGSIYLADGFKPISLGGTVEGSVKFTGAKQADGTQILKTSAKKITAETLAKAFDVSAINTGTVTAHLYYLKSGKACIFGDAISYNGKDYGIWKDVIADMNAAQKAAKKAGTKANFTVSLKGDVDMMGAFKMPSGGYASITIIGNSHKMTFTGDIKLTGDTVISGVVLNKVNKKGVKVEGKVKKGKYNYSGPEKF